jgi:hypothetical protein
VVVVGGGVKRGRERDQLWPSAILPIRGTTLEQEDWLLSSAPPDPFYPA